MSRSGATMPCVSALPQGRDSRHKPGRSGRPQSRIAPPGYRRHRPETTLLYQLVAELGESSRSIENARYAFSGAACRDVRLRAKPREYLASRPRFDVDSVAMFSVERLPKHWLRIRGWIQANMPVAQVRHDAAVRPGPRGTRCSTRVEPRNVPCNKDSQNAGAGTQAISGRGARLAPQAMRRTRARSASYAGQAPRSRGVRPGEPTSAATRIAAHCSARSALPSARVAKRRARRRPRGTRWRRAVSMDPSR